MTNVESLSMSIFCFFDQGVPVMAIKNKMILEGLDPGLLE